MTYLPAASMATLAALVNTFLAGAIAGTAYLSLGGTGSLALVCAGGTFVIASIVVWGWVFLQLRQIRQRLVVRFPQDH